MDMIARYPRLVRAMQRVALLSANEAESALRDWRAGRRAPYHGPDAVVHFGGPRAVIRAAIRWRHRWPR